MSAKQRIIQQANDLTDLETLANLVANPKAIKAAGEAARAEVTLTQEQEAKHAAALATIAKAAQIEAQIKSREDALAHAKAIHEQGLIAFAKQKEDFHSTVDAINTDIAGRQAALASAIAKHEDDKKQATTQNAVAEAALKRRELAAQKKEEDNKRITEAQELEGARLAASRDAINQKAKRLAQAIEG